MQMFLPFSASSAASSEVVSCGDGQRGWHDFTATCNMLLYAWLYLFLSLAVPQALNAAEPKGWIDAVDPALVSGWACDPDVPGRVLGIHIYATGTNGNGTCHGEGSDRLCYVGGGAAAHMRPDLADADCGGHKSHGFMIPTPGYLLDGQQHRVYGYAINAPEGTNPVLSGSPKTFDSPPIIDVVPPLYRQSLVGAKELAEWIVQPSCVPDFKPHMDIAKIYSSHSASCGQYKTPIPWSVSDFTGFSVPDPVADYQRGIFRTWYGSDAIQASGTTVGIHHHPESVHELGSIGFHTVGLVYNWQTNPHEGPVTAARPWQESNQRHIRFEGWMRAPKASIFRSDQETERTAAYLSFVLKFNNINHITSHISVTVSIVDPERCGAGVTSEHPLLESNILWDLGQWSIPIAQSFLHPSSVLVTKVPESGDTACSTFGEERYFAFDLNGDQFEQIVQLTKNKFRADLQAKGIMLPDLAADYYLNHINVQNEIAIKHADSRAWLSVSIRDLTVRLIGIEQP
ncbi:hypothetical protein GGE65_007403 [Skermanella aerolata]|uniref:hypothetical protein n=1 Tax=Skermanella aerolata TaxID=393310 RepID=UPI003D245FA0